MDYEKINFIRIICLIFISTFGIVVLKWLLNLTNCLLAKINPNLFFSDKFRKYTYFLDEYFDSFNSLFWFSYIIVSLIVSLIFFLFLCAFNKMYDEELNLYRNGTYEFIAKYENFEELPNWNNNAKSVIISAEKINSVWFKDNNPNFYFVLPDENGNYPILKDGIPTGKYLQPINTNIMYSKFLDLIKNEQEVIK